MVVDADGRIVTERTSMADGRLIGVAPTMYFILQKLASELPGGDRFGDLARRAIKLADEGWPNPPQAKEPPEPPTVFSGPHLLAVLPHEPIARVISALPTDPEVGPVDWACNVEFERWGVVRLFFKRQLVKLPVRRGGTAQKTVGQWEVVDAVVVKPTRTD